MTTLNDYLLAVQVNPDTEGYSLAPLISEIHGEATLVTVTRRNQSMTVLLFSPQGEAKAMTVGRSFPDLVGRLAKLRGTTPWHHELLRRKDFANAYQQ